MLNLKLLPSAVSPAVREVTARPTGTLFGRAGRWVILAGLTLVVLETSLRLHDWLRLGLPFFWDPVRNSPNRPEVTNAFLLCRPPVENWHARGKTSEQIIHAEGSQVIRVICLGGSTTWEEQNRKEAGVSYVTELQARLNEKLGTKSDMVVEVINAGFPDFTTLHSLVLLQTELLALKPSVVVLQGHLDDLIVNYFPEPDRLAYGARLLHQTELPRELQADKRGSLLEHSRLHEWAREGLRQNVWYRMKYRDEQDGPQQLPQKEVYRQHLRSFVAVAKAQGVQVVLISQVIAQDPALFEKYFRRKPFTAELRYPRIEEFTDHVRQYNEVMRSVAHEQRIECLDPECDGTGDFADVVQWKPSVSKRLAARLAELKTFDAALGLPFAF